MTKRCTWAESTDEMRAYHDKEWGVPLHDDRKLFEFLCLEGAQAGLSWQTVLAKRENYRLAFDNFDAAKIARYDEAKRHELLQNAGIIRNRLKVNAFIENAKAYLVVQQEQPSFSDYIWQFTDGKQITHPDQARALELSAVMSKTLKKQGFRFVGPTICYSFMQAAGLVDDHEPSCFRAQHSAPKGG